MLRGEVRHRAEALADLHLDHAGREGLVVDRGAQARGAAGVALVAFVHEDELAARQLGIAGDLLRREVLLPFCAAAAGEEESGAGTENADGGERDGPRPPTVCRNVSMRSPPEVATPPLHLTAAVHRGRTGGRGDGRLGRPRNPPERARALPRVGVALGVLGQHAEIDDVQRAAGRVEAAGDGPLEAAGAEERAGPLDLPRLTAKSWTMPALGFDAHDFEADGREQLADARRHVAELGDERVALVAELGAAAEIEAVGRGVNAEPGGRLGRRVGVLGEQELRRGPPGRGSGRGGRSGPRRRSSRASRTTWRAGAG